MIGGEAYARTERYGGVELRWTNHLDAAGSRIEWRIETDSRGWYCSYGPVHNDGILCGSRAIATQAEEQNLLRALREKAMALAGFAPASDQQAA